MPQWSGIVLNVEVNVDGHLRPVDGLRGQLDARLGVPIPVGRLLAIVQRRTNDSC